MKDTNKSKDSGRINFVGKNFVFAVTSIALVIGSIGMLLTEGLNYGIDFAGGTEVQVKFEKDVETSRIRTLLDEVGIDSAQVQNFGDENEFLIRFESGDAGSDQEANQIITERINAVTGGIKSTLGDFGPVIRRVDSVGPQIGEQLKRNGVLAVFYSLLLILIYVGLRFDYNFAPGAVVCLFHDSIITLGIFSLINKEINVQILAAVLTIIGYSLNDTIVVFDRIRENVAAYRNKKMSWIVNRSLNDTLSRTVLTSATTLLAVLALNLFAGGVIADFALALGIGIIIGTYSSIYIAAPLVIQFEKLKGRKSKA